MSSVAPFLFEDVVGNINRPFRFAVIGEVDPLLFSHQAKDAPLLAVTKTGYGQQPKGTKKQAHTKPNTAMAFVLGDGSAKDGARYPEEKNRQQEPNHHQSVTAP